MIFSRIKIVLHSPMKVCTLHRTERLARKAVKRMVKFG